MAFMDCNPNKTAAARIGVMGGSFDPIHCGHIAAAEEAAERMWFDRLVLVPTGMPPHKPAGNRASAEHRLAMARAAVEHHTFIEVSDIEVRREGVSYTVDTLRALGGELPEGSEISLLLGTDAVRDLPMWRDVAGIFEIAHPVVIQRPGDARVDWEALSSELPDGIGKRLCECIIKLQNGIAISSTEIREAIARGEPISEMVPGAVARYIDEHGLYREDRSA
jgi:nicotinate-nucleotide adenylyltransferase